MNKLFSCSIQFAKLNCIMVIDQYRKIPVPNRVIIPMPEYKPELAELLTLQYQSTGKIPAINTTVDGVNIVEKRSTEDTIFLVCEVIHNETDFDKTNAFTIIKNREKRIHEEA
jgi:hypothetical protein